MSIPLPAVSDGEKGISELLLSSNIAFAARVGKVLRDKKGSVSYEHLHKMAGVLQTNFIDWERQTNLKTLRKREILAKIADFAQQLLFREAQQLWSDPKWIAPPQARRGHGWRVRHELSLELKQMGDRFAVRRDRELKCLCKRFAVKPGFAMTVPECSQVLRFVGKRHDLMHSDVKEMTTIEGIQACISEAMEVTREDWPADMEAPPELIRRMLKRYEEIVTTAAREGRAMMWDSNRGNAFTGKVYKLA
jgi:hypothetical protein